MQIANLSSFISYDLDVVEYRAAYTFNEAQRAGIQNLLAASAEDLLKRLLSEDDTSIEAVKKSAYTQGMIAAYKHLLSLHDSINSPIQQPTQGNEQ